MHTKVVHKIVKLGAHTLLPIVFSKALFIEQFVSLHNVSGRPGRASTWTSILMNDGAGAIPDAFADAVADDDGAGNRGKCAPSAVTVAVESREFDVLT